MLSAQWFLSYSVEKGAIINVASERENYSNQNYQPGFEAQVVEPHLTWALSDVLVNLLYQMTE